MKKITLVLVICVTLILSSSVLVGSQSGYISKHMQQRTKIAEQNLFRGTMLLRLKDEIGLNADQVSKIEQLNLSFQESMIRRMADTKVKELKMANYLQSSKVNRKTVGNMIREISKLKTDLQIDRIYYLLNIKDLLTPEQIQKIEKLRKSSRQRAFHSNRKGKSEKRPMGRPGIR